MAPALSWLATLAVAAAGAALFALVGFPAPFLTGPALAVTLAALAGVPVAIPAPLRDLCFLTIGIGIGASVTPEVLTTAITWPLSFAVLAITILAILWVCRRVLERVYGFDRLSALLSATPGHLSFILGLSADLRADVSRIALVQSMRVLLLTLMVPILLTLWGVEGGVVARPVVSLNLISLGVLAAGSVLVGLAFKRWSVPAAYLLAGMAVSATGHVTGLTPGAMPEPITVAAFATMGAIIGTRFRGLAWAEVRSALSAGAALTLIACVIAGVAAVAVAAVLDLSPALLLISFAPGGVEAMAAMAVLIGVEPTFVAAHHVTRLLVLTVLIPWLLMRLRRRGTG
ncbi:AbrB family transcriptional regulator [Rhodobacteraceae bacterium CCMM004]|nr:AbrB family transcriptional regulator [Rhodobacteraceae bacterium CCMM004]